jgi:protein TIF31
LREPYLYTFYFRYVHNNIFFSFAVDSDYEHISKDQKPDCQNGSSKSSEVSSPALGAKADKKHAGSSEAAKNPEEPHISDDASAEAQLADSEQATYASANNDLKGTKAYQEADISGLYNLAMTIIDYRGHRVVAQVCTENVFWYIALSVFLFEHALHISFFHS